MSDDKLKYTFRIHVTQLDMLRDAAQQYDLPDEHKALRIILDYVTEEGDPEEIFASKRCLHC